MEKTTSSHHRHGGRHPPGPYRRGQLGRPSARACAASPPSPIMTPPARRSSWPPRSRTSTPPTCMDKKEARRMDRFTQFAMAAAAEAMADSGLDLEQRGPLPLRRHRLQRHRRAARPSENEHCQGLEKGL